MANSVHTSSLYTLCFPLSTFNIKPPGNRDKSGLVTVASSRTWRGWPAENPRPLTGG